MLLTGSTGFHGRALLERLPQAGYTVRILVRSTLPASPGVEAVMGDLRDPAAVLRALRGVDAIVHAASYVGPDPALAWQVNGAGTAVLARAAGGRPMVAIGTAAVYGPGPHRGVDEDEVAANPASMISRSRLIGERAVLGAGGTVLRPHLVHGHGDRWFVPGLAGALERLGGLVGDGTSLMSVIEVGELARAAIATLAIGHPGGVLHVTREPPITVADAATAVASLRGDSPPSAGVHPERAAELLGARATLLGCDHWFRADRLWSLIGPPRLRPLHDEFLDARAWYHGSLTSSRVGEPAVRRGDPTTGSSGGRGEAR